MSTEISEDTYKRDELRPEAMFFSAASFPGETTAKRLRPSFGAVIETLGAEIAAIAARMTSARSRAEFHEIKDREFVSYARLSSAIGNVLRSVLSQDDHARLVQEALHNLETKFFVEATEYLGQDHKQEILFAFNSLKRAFQCIPQMLSRELPAEAKEQDEKLARSFAYYVLLSQLHFDCLGYALSKRESVAPDVLQEIIDGIRHSVMAYACVREALDLRGFSEARYSDAPTDVIWDDEDKNFANF